MTLPTDTDQSVRRARARGCATVFLSGMLLMGALWGAGLGIFVSILDGAETTIEAVEEFRPKIGSKVYSADGEAMGEFAIESRQLIPLNEIPLHVQKAFIATEDDTFYEHRGVRPLALLSAIIDSFRTNRLRGASTITQQIVRNIEDTGISTEQTVQRKFREILVALQLERKFTKDEILEMYLNQIFLGVSAYGVESAAQQYYGRSIRDVTLGEAALLAGLTRAPNKNQPFRYPENATLRRDIVLAQMRDNRFIGEAAYEVARLEDVAASVLTPEQRSAHAVRNGHRLQPGRFQAPYFVEEVRRFISKPPAPHDVGATQEELFEGGLEISTTLDLRLQEAGERILLQALEAFDESKLRALTRDGREKEFVPVSGALVCLDNRPGYEGFVRVMVGGRNFQERKFNLATQALRQPGSSVKPFVWLASLDQGMTPSSIVVDEPYTRIDAVGNLWEPGNFDDEFQGPVPIRKALEQSINIVAIKLVERIGMPVVRSYLRSAGFRQPISDVVGLTIALGTPETTVLDQAVCYSTLASGGVRTDPVLVAEIRDRDGISRYDYRTFRRVERVFPADVTYQAVHLMEGVCEPVIRKHTSSAIYYPSGRRTAKLDRPRAGKTGTTNGATNVWFCGFTPQYTCVVWMGYEEGLQSLGEGSQFAGGALASPIWTDFMIEAHQGLPVKEFKVPAGVEFHEIDRATGLAGGGYREAFIRGTAPPTEMPVFEMPEELERLLVPSRFPGILDGAEGR